MDLIDLKIFKNIFINKKINIKKIIILESIFIIILFLIILLINNLYVYYNNSGEVKDDYLVTIVNIKDLEIISNNNKLKINNKEYVYKIIDIKEDDFVSNGMLYKVVYLGVDNYKSIENNYVEYQIVKEKETILNYFIKTLKGG
jgi:hypothetical protein